MRHPCMSRRFHEILCVANKQLEFFMQLDYDGIHMHRMSPQYLHGL